MAYTLTRNHNTTADNRYYSKSTALLPSITSQLIQLTPTTTEILWKGHQAGINVLLLLLHPFNGLFSRTIWVSQYQKSKKSLNLNEARDEGVLESSGISWTVYKQSAPRSRQLTTSTPHHSVFIGRMLFLMPNQQCQSTEGNWYQHLVLTYCIVNITQLKTLITYRWHFNLKSDDQCW